MAEPSMTAALIRAWLTMSTPGVERSSSASSGLSPVALSHPPACTMWVPVNSFSSEPAMEVFAEAANTVMNPTRPTPIIRAEAVRAVRFGFRIALRVASSPLSPRIRSGMPNTLATGRASTGPSTDTPTNVTSAPTPTSAISPPRPASSAATPTAVMAVPTTARRTEPAERSTSTSRSAANGAILAALRAGSHADSTVTISPTANDRAIALGEITVAPSGMSKPNADISRLRPEATPMPAARPAPDESAPMTTASMSTERFTWRPDAPIARSIAISRVLWATVIENVLLMMNAPTNTATTAKTSEIVSNSARLAAIDSWLSATSVAPVITSTSLPTAAWIAAVTSACDVPWSAVTAIASAWPGVASSSVAAVSVNSTAVAPAGESAVPNVAMPAMVNCRGALLVSTVATSPGWYPALSALALSMTISPSLPGACPLASSYGLRSSTATQFVPNAGCLETSPTGSPS